MADQNAEGVIAQARAAAPVAQPQAPVAPAPATPEPQPSGFGGQQPVNGFAPTTPAPVEAPVTPEPAQPLATENDRTREQFEKLTDTNQRLADTNELLRRELMALQENREKSNQQFAPVQQPVTPATTESAMPKLSDYIEIDPRTGERFVNEAKFNAAVADIYQKASRAEETVQKYVQTAEQREIERQEKEAFSSYPDLNPRATGFDKTFSQQTRAILYDSLLNPQDYGGRPLGFKEAADFVRGQTGQPVVPTTLTPTVNEENQVQKEQAALAAQSVPQQVTQNIDSDREYNKLVQGTRLGSDEAIAVRLLNADHRLADIEAKGN